MSVLQGESSRRGKERVRNGIIGFFLAYQYFNVVNYKSIWPFGQMLFG